jgi:hypothetical protein
MHDALLRLLKAKETREGVLAWIALIVELNVVRGKCVVRSPLRRRAVFTPGRMRADMSQVSSDGFFLNLCAVLLRLCGPFIEPGTDKIRLVDPTFVGARRARRE